MKESTIYIYKQGKSEGFDSCDRPSNLTQIGFKSSIFQSCDLEIWLMISKNYRAPLLHYIKLWASSQTPRWTRTAVAVWKRSIRVKIGDFFPRVTLKFNGWAWKTIGILFYVTLSCLHHSKAIGEFKLKLQSGNAQFRQFFAPCDLKIWWITLKNNRAPLLCCFKLYASFHNHWWIHTKVTVRKRSIRVKIGNFLSRMTLKFDEWPWKTIGHLFYATSSFVHHFVAIDEFKLELQSGNAQFGSKSTIFRAVWPWNLMDDLEKQ